MANEFKTISLEERWKNSIHNRQPLPPQPVSQGSSNIILPEEVSQGSVDLKIPKRDPIQEQISLKQIPIGPKKEPTTLKLTGQSLIANTIPNPVIVQAPLLESRERPFVNTDYRTAISLRNRLEQSTTLGSTNHLAQYFLSDQYADYIKVIPFGIFNHTSTIILEDGAFTPNQGGLDPTVFLFDSLLFQGVIVKNGEIVSIPNIETPLQNILNYQGAIQVNGNYVSFTNVEQSIPTSQLQQDLNVTVTNPADVNTIGFSQGLIQVPNGEIGSISIIDSPRPTPSQGGTSVLPFTYEPNRTPVNPSVLRYAADRALAYFTPRIKHGSVYVEPLPNYYGTNPNPDLEGSHTNVRWLHD